MLSVKDLKEINWILSASLKRAALEAREMREEGGYTEDQHSAAQVVLDRMSAVAERVEREIKAEEAASAHA